MEKRSDKICIRLLLRNLIPMVCSFLILLIIPPTHAGQERYYIDGQPVLLYKLINHWYTSLVSEKDMLCGLTLTCESHGNGRLAYDTGAKRLTISVGDGLADLVCFTGPAHQNRRLPTCTFVHPSYFKGARPGIKSFGDMLEHGFEFDSMPVDQVDDIRFILPDLAFVLEGPITGLADGRVAMAGCGSRIKTCPIPAAAQNTGWLSLKIIHPASGELLVIYVLEEESHFH